MGATGTAKSSTDAFREEVRRQCLSVAASPAATDDQNFIDSVADRNDRMVRGRRGVAGAATGIDGIGAASRRSRR